MFNTNTPNITSYVVLVALLVAIIILLWELLKARIIPPFRIERAKHPGWYWSCIVTHAVVVAFLVLFCGALALASLSNDFFN
jgi:hypothetical protein